MCSLTDLQLSSGQSAGLWALWCLARGWAMCAGQGGRGVVRGQELTPPLLTHTGSPPSGILMTARRESLRQRKLSQATSCDRLARMSFIAWIGPQIWNLQHYEAAHGKAFIAILSVSHPSSYPGWNEIENTLSTVCDLTQRSASQEHSGRSNQAFIIYTAIL